MLKSMHRFLIIFQVDDDNYPTRIWSKASLAAPEFNPAVRPLLFENLIELYGLPF